MFWYIFRYLSQVCFYLFSNTSRNPFEGYACLILGILCQVIQESHMQLELSALTEFPRTRSRTDKVQLCCWYHQFHRIFIGIENTIFMSQTSFGHISINSPSILTVSMATKSPWKDLSIDTSHVSRRSIMAEILGRSTGNHHGTVY